MAFSNSRLRVRHGRRFTVRYVVNDAARVTVEGRKGRNRVTGATRSGRAGRNSIPLRVAKRGDYMLVIVTTRPGGAATDRIPLNVR